MLFHQVLIAGLIALVAGDWSQNYLCKGKAAGTYANPKNCAQSVTCDAAGVATIATCPDGAGGLKGMWSTTQNACVLTFFPGCFIQKKYCPTLPKEVVARRSEASELIAREEQLDQIDTEEFGDLGVSGLQGNTDCTSATVNDGAYGFIGNCKVYQICCGTTSSMHKCPFGLQFDTVSRQCAFKATCRTAA